MAATENPQVGATEIWEVANLTEDAHPIHIHLMQFQVITRQVFDGDNYLADWMAAFPGGTFNGFTFAAGTYIPGYGPPSNVQRRQQRRRVGRQPGLRRRELLQQGACAGGAARGARGERSGWKDTIKMFPEDGHADRRALGAAGDPPPNRRRRRSGPVHVRSDRTGAGLRLALSHPRSRGQ